MPDAVANDRVPFAHEDRVASFRQEPGQIVKPVAQRFRLSIFELAKNEAGLHPLPEQALEHHQVVPFGIDLEEVDRRKVVFLHDMIQGRYGNGRGLLVAIGEGRQGADAGALRGGIEGGARVGIVAHGPRVDGQLRMGAVIVLESRAVFGIGLECDDPPAPPEEGGKRTPMMRPDVDHDGTRRRFGEEVRRETCLVDVRVFASCVRPHQNHFDILKIAKGKYVQFGFRIGVEHRDTSILKPFSRHLPACHMQVGLRGIGNVVTVTFPLVIVNKVVWVVPRVVHNFQNVSLHLLRTGKALDVIAIYPQKVEASVSEHGSKQRGMASRREQIARQQRKTLLHLVEYQNTRVILHVRQFVDEIPAQQEVSDAVR